MSDALLSEIERQQAYLDRLPSAYTYTLFDTKQAVESQRRSGYKDSASASREIVDNSIEAGATRVDVVFNSSKSASNGKLGVNAIAFIDDASGMLPQMARYSLSWGGGTHYDDPAFIGRFGFGLPNASINQTRSVSVYTRTDAAEPFMMAELDIAKLEPFGVQTIAEPVPAELPDFVTRYLKASGLEIGHGTVVVWREPDRLTYRTPSLLKEHLLDDFGVTYRYILQRDGHTLTDRHIALYVDGTRVEATDPLFLLPGARYYVPEEDGGAQLIEEKDLEVRFFHDPVTGEKRLVSRDSSGELAFEPDNEVVGNLHVRVGRFPVGFAAGDRKGDLDAYRRFEIRKSRRGMSFVRCGRELQTVDVFPRSQHDKASGLGDWPLLQGYAYHWGIEVRFSPELDDVLGITNDKQGVRPIEDFWRVLADAEIDDALRRENRWQEDRRKKAPADTPPVGYAPTPAEQAARAADVALGEPRRVPPRFVEAAKKAAEEEAVQRAEESGESVETMRQAAEKEAQRKPYAIGYHEDPRGPFYQPQWNGSQLRVLINKSHTFYTSLYSDLLQLPGGRRAKEALDLVLLALCKSELNVSDDEIALFLRTQREEAWSKFLDVSLNSLVSKMVEDDEIAEE